MIFSFTLASPRIDRVTCLSPKPAVLQRLEFKVDLSAQYKNPYDPADISLDATVRLPSGRTLSIPGFLYQPFRRSTGPVKLPIAYASDAALKSGALPDQDSIKGEVLSPEAPPDWRVRFTPTEAGVYQLSFRLATDGEQAKAFASSLNVGAAKGSRGFVGIDPQNAQGFRTSTGNSFFPIGANMCWAGSRGTLDYDDWLPRYGAANANWGRLWLSPMWTTFSLQPQTEPDRVDLANAWRLDYAMDEAAAQGIYMTLCIDSYNILRSGNNWPEWDRSPFNRKNGGPLDHPSEFWTDPEAARVFKNKLRYLVARWGADFNVFSWEFWNEVDGVSDYQPAPVLAWHRKMSDYLRSIDPQRHMIATSFGGDGLSTDVFSLPNIDYSIAHVYSAPDESVAVVTILDRLKKLGKPSFIEECGADTEGPRAEDDPQGLQLHNPLWASIASGASAGSMLWWWDSLIAPKNLYPQLAHASAFLKGVDWGREHFHPVSPRLAFAIPPKNPVLQDIELEQAPPSWAASPQNKPLQISLDKDGLHGGPVAAILHGTGNHPDLHNPITFVTNLDHPTVLDLRVDHVSGYGGAALRVSVDGKIVIDENFKEPDGAHGTQDLVQYSGVRKCPIPSGPHRVLVKNDGQDWVQLGYVFEKAQISNTPPLKVWASVGRSTVFAWLRIDNGSWRNVIERKTLIPPCPPSKLSIEGLTPGKWRAEIWDTWHGQVVGRATVTASSHRPATIDIPKIGSDLAVKLIRE